MEMKVIALTTVILSFFQCACITALPLSSGGMHFTPDNIRYYASYLHSSADIQDRVIHFGSGSVIGEKLLDIPIGHIDPHATIIITVGLNNSHPNTPAVDSDPRIGISDGSNSNAFIVVDIGNYASSPPCRVYPGVHDDTRVSSNAQVPSTVKLTIVPFYKYGACETAHNGGYINTGRFNAQIDIRKPLYLTVLGDNTAEDLYFHYFNVQIVSVASYRELEINNS